MDIESMFSGGKWQLIELLSRKELSPLQLSEILGTSVANVSQQLKLLDLLGLLSTVKVPNREKGKPRTLYSLSNDYVYVISVLKNYAGKHLIKASPIHSAMARIMCIPETELHYPLMKLFWRLEPSFEYIKALYFDKSKATMFVVSENQSKLKLQASYSFRQGFGSFEISIKLLSKFPLELEGQYPIYDPGNLLRQKEGEE